MSDHEAVEAGIAYFTELAKYADRPGEWVDDGRLDELFEIWCDKCRAVMKKARGAT